MKDYKKILEGVVHIINTTEKSDIGFDNICAYIGENCPELKESEDDRIRKEIITFIKKRDRSGCDYDYNQWLAWLENQGEQKVANKVEPKFKVGDWVIDKQGIAHQIANVVENVTNHTYGYSIVGGGYFNDNTEGIRLWTIQDAKGGDVLASKGGEDILIFRNLDTNTSFSSYYNIAGRGALGWSNRSFIPATKEQRSIIEKAIVDAGYTFDFDKKELNEIEEYDGDDYGIDSLWHARAILKKTLGKVDGYQSDDGILEHKCAISVVDTLYKQKPSWSVEDSSKVQRICKYLVEAKKYYADITEVRDCIDWLKAVETRYAWKPSDGQKDALEHFVRSIGEGGFVSPYDANLKLVHSLLNDLKKLK